MKKRNIIMSIFLTIISVIYTYLVKTYDVKNIGPNNSKVGFSKINSWFSNLIGSHMTIYKITEVLGFIVLLIVAIYGVLGLYQLIKRKSLLKEVEPCGEGCGVSHHLSRNRAAKEAVLVGGPGVEGAVCD